MTHCAGGAGDHDDPAREPAIVGIDGEDGVVATIEDPFFRHEDGPVGGAVSEEIACLDVEVAAHDVATRG